jgi:hypothetical protein
MISFKPVRIKSLIFTLFAACFTSAYGGEGIVKSNGCIKAYNITRGASPWQGFTSTHAEEQASKNILSLNLKNSDYKPVASLEKYSGSGMIIIGRNEKLRRVAVEASLFSELKRADATRNTSGRFLIGTYKDPALKIMKPRELAGFLIESQIINTFWHVESFICLVSEEESPAAYTAHYKGDHIYFTNSKNQDPLDFTITIDKKTGEMFVEAR